MAFNLSGWLKKTPQPTAVMADDKRIEVPKNHRAIRDLTQTIKAMEPSKLTCLNANGDVIRSISLESEDDKGAPAASAEMSDLQLFAKLLAEGYEHGRKANQPIIDSAMQFVERQSVRLAKAENEIERLRAHNHKLNLHIAELTATPVVERDENETVMGALVAGAMQGMAQAQLQPKPQPVTPIKGGKS